MTARRERLDVLVAERHGIASRARAQALIRAGEVEVDGQIVDKPGHLVNRDARIDLRARPLYVSRGGLKLAHALDRFGIDPRGLACLDVGASTGGFTDVLVQRGARRVYAVDVGWGQLAWGLRGHPAVVVLERTDIRTVAALPEAVDLAVIDVAFISLRLVLPAVQRLLAPDGQVVALVKPQFEAGRASVGRGGVVRDPDVHRAVVHDTVAMSTRAGWRVLGVTASPITGADGNREFLLWLAAPGTEAASVPWETLRAQAGLDDRD
ncbi:MAG: TlyA family RNA methyltransferase [Chloroflexi bacterium CFX6]|nr:TlyA family RNA methyltransferase [Chloroflexi bacterium CFX6]